MSWPKQKYRFTLLVLLAFFIVPGASAQDEDNAFSSLAGIIEDIFVSIGQLVSMSGLNDEQEALFLRAIVFFAIFTAFYMGGQFALRNFGEKTNKYAGIFAFLIALTTTVSMPNAFIDPLTGSLTLMVMSLMFLAVLGLPLYVMYSFLPSVTTHEGIISGARFTISIVSILIVSMFSTAVLEGDQGQINEGLLSIISTLPGLLLIAFSVTAFLSAISLFKFLGIGSTRVSDGVFENTSNMFKKGSQNTKNVAKDLLNKTKKGVEKAKDTIKESKDARDWGKTERKRQQRDKKAAKDMLKQEKDEVKTVKDIVETEEDAEEDVNQLELCFVAMNLAVKEEEIDNALQAFERSKKVKIGSSQSKMYNGPGLPLLIKDLNDNIKGLHKEIKRLGKDIKNEEADIEVLLKHAKDLFSRKEFQSSLTEDLDYLEERLNAETKAEEVIEHLNMCIRALITKRSNLVSLTSSIKTLLDQGKTSDAEKPLTDVIHVLRDLRETENKIRSSLTTMAKLLQ